MNEAEDFSTVRNWEVEDENFLGALSCKDAHRFETRMPQSWVPSHIRLCGKKRERVVGGE